jgi:nitrous oxidase accessory protein
MEFLPSNTIYRLSKNSILLIVLIIISIPLVYGGDLWTVDTPSILYVGGSGSGNYSFIQQAIDNASKGDTVFVYSGVYYENIIIDTSIILQGENKEVTIIDGGNYGDIPCIDIIADNVYVHGFMIRWADWEYHEPGIRIISENVRIFNNNISIHDKGIILISGAKNSIIENNIISNNHEGIYIYPSSGEGHIIRNNRFSDNNYAFLIYNSYNLTVENNSFVKNDWYGILMKNSRNCIIFKNSFENNSMGISIDSDCSSNLLFNNNFISNRRQALDEGFNLWNMENPCGGNYWSDYTGSDTNGDGIGDNPYSIPGLNSNTDLYPFITKNKWLENPLRASFLIPEYGFVQEQLIFNISIEGGIEPYHVHWDFGDNGTTNINNPNHTYESPGDYTIFVSIVDGYLNRIYESSTITVYNQDTTPPFVSIISPETGIYVFDKMICPIPRPLSLIVGNFFIHVEAYDTHSAIKEIQIKIDDIIFETFQSNEYIFNWPQSMSGLHIFEVEAIDIAGNSAKDKRYILNF